MTGGHVQSAIGGRGREGKYQSKRHHDVDYDNDNNDDKR